VTHVALFQSKLCGTVHRSRDTAITSTLAITSTQHEPAENESTPIASVMASLKNVRQECITDSQR
jgi:hypothetical protein